MRFTTTVALALPLLAAAQQNPLDLVQEGALFWFDKISQFLPSPNIYNHAEAAAAKAAGNSVEVLNIDNWQDIIRPAGKTFPNGPEQWWVAFTGGNKTCFGWCEPFEKAFNESAALFKVNPKAPHMAMVHCERQPIICSGWTAGPPSVWVMEVGPVGTPVNIHKVGVNTTSVTAKTFTDMYSTSSWKQKPVYEGYFHPFDGPIANAGLQKPLGYVLWLFALVPSWAFMIGVSFLSRTMMSRRMAPPTAGGAGTTGAPPPAAAPRAS